MVTLSGLRVEMESLRMDLIDCRKSTAKTEQDLWTRMAEMQTMNDELRVIVGGLQDDLKRERDTVNVLLPLNFI